MIKHVIYTPNYTIQDATSSKSYNFICFCKTEVNLMICDADLSWQHSFSVSLSQPNDHWITRLSVILKKPHQHLRAHCLQPLSAAPATAERRQPSPKSHFNLDVNAIFLSCSYSRQFHLMVPCFYWLHSAVFMTLFVMVKRATRHTEARFLHDKSTRCNRTMTWRSYPSFHGFLQWAPCALMRDKFIHFFFLITNSLRQIEHPICSACSI